MRVLMKRERLRSTSLGIRNSGKDVWVGAKKQMGRNREKSRTRSSGVGTVTHKDLEGFGKIHVE